MWGSQRARWGCRGGGRGLSSAAVAPTSGSLSSLSIRSKRELVLSCQFLMVFNVAFNRLDVREEPVNGEITLRCLEQRNVALS